MDKKQNKELKSVIEKMYYTYGRTEYLMKSLLSYLNDKLSWKINETQFLQAVKELGSKVVKITIDKHKVLVEARY